MSSRAQQRLDVSVALTCGYFVAAISVELGVNLWYVVLGSALIAVWRAWQVVR